MAGMLQFGEMARQRLSWSAISIFIFLTASALSAQQVRPVIQYANFFGGSGTDSPLAVTAGSDGSVYMVGLTTSADFPNATYLSPSDGAGTDHLFVVKLDPTGALLQYNVIVGAAGTQTAAIAVDETGNVYVAGDHAAPTFPITGTVAPDTFGGFLFKLDPTGSKIVYSTGLKGVRTVAPNGLKVDSSGNAYLAGVASGMPSTAGAAIPGSFGPFAMKINAQGSRILYATLLTGTASYASPESKALAIDGNGNAYITGSADAKTFPATVSLPSSADPDDNDVFVVKINADGTRLEFAARFGGYGTDVGSSLAVDPDGYIYVVGSSHTETGSGPEQPFPTTEGALFTLSGQRRGFLTKLSPDGASLAFSTLIPNTYGAGCLRVQTSGIDVLAFQYLFGRSALYGETLFRINARGNALLNSSLVGVGAPVICGGLEGGTVALTSPKGFLDNWRPASPSLEPIGAKNIWITAISANTPGAPHLDVDKGELLLEAWRGDSGNVSPVSTTINVSSGGASVPLSAYATGYVSVDPARVSTPSTLTVTAPQGSDSEWIVLFAPGVQDGLVPLPVSMRNLPVTFDATPKATIAQPLIVTADSPTSAPVLTKFTLSSHVETGLFRSVIPVRTTFAITTPPQVLSVDRTTGATPTQITLTADPSGLFSGGIYNMPVQVNDPAAPPGYSADGLWLPIQFRVGPTAIAPALLVTPLTIGLRLTPDHTSDSKTVHLSSSGAPLAFSVGLLPDGVTASAMSGVTPADITFSAAFSSPQSSSYYPTRITFQDRTGGTAIGSVDLTLTRVLADYLGVVNCNRLTFLGPGPNDAWYAPGGLFLVRLDPILLWPPMAEEANPAALSFSLAGYSFKMGGIPVPLLSYADGQFEAQIPPDVPPGTATLDVYDSEGARVALGSMTLGQSAPSYAFASSDRPRAQKADGSQINPNNPVYSGDTIVVKITGQGSVVPPIPSGKAASTASASVPVLPVMVTVGGKIASILSATMSTKEAGILDVRIQVPALAAGDHKVRVTVGDGDAGDLPIRIATGVAVPHVGAAGIVNAASFAAPLAPGTLFSIFGTNLAPSVQNASRFPLPYLLNQVSVTVDGKLIPLLYVSPGQINAQIPYEQAETPAAQVVVSVNGNSSNVASAPVARAAPGIFEFGKNRAVVQNEDGSINDTGNGASPGEAIVIYLTGTGVVDNVVATGAPAAVSPLSRVQADVRVTIGDVLASVEFAGLTPAFAGLTQVNARVPSLLPGAYPVVITVNGVASNSALVTVK